VAQFQKLQLLKDRSDRGASSCSSNKIWKENENEYLSCKNGLIPEQFEIEARSSN
jgi:hypothetical protein